MQNLERLDIISVAVVGNIDLVEGRDEQLHDILVKHEANWPSNAIDKLGFYEIDGIRHHVGLDIEIASDRDSDEAAFAVEAHSFHRGEHFSLSDRANQEKQFEEIQAILSDLRELGAVNRLHSHVAWRFQPGSKKSIIDLPLMTTQSASLPFTEISGIRFKKRTSEGMTAVIIDLQEDRSLAVRLMLPAAQTEISSEMLDSVVQKGRQVISEFILEPSVAAEDGDSTI